MSGTIIKVVGVKRLRVGDHVWADLGKTWMLRGGELGAYAEYAVADENQVGLKPPHLSFAEAGVAPRWSHSSASISKDRCPRRGSMEEQQEFDCSHHFWKWARVIWLFKSQKHTAQNIIAAGGPDSLDMMRQWGATTVVDYHSESVFAAAGGNDTVVWFLTTTGAPEQLTKRCQ